MDIRKYEQIADKLRESWSITDEKQEIIIKEESADAITELVAHIKSTPESEQKPVAWATTNEDGDYAMLFFDKQEALSYSGDDEPIGLAPVSSSAHQPDYKAQRYALLDVVQSAVEELRELKRAVGFRANTLEVIQKCDAAIASVKGGA